jgi:predicted nucleic acid-binding protein
VARISLDSNILIYAEGTDDLSKRDVVVPLIADIGRENIVLPMQAAGETLRWLIRKGKLNRRAAVRKMEWWLDECDALPITTTAFRHATSLIEHHQFQVWDAVILAASAEAQASVLLSEDMQHGFQWSGVTIVNPFMLTSEQLRNLVPPRILH